MNAGLFTPLFPPLHSNDSNCSSNMRPFFTFLYQDLLFKYSLSPSEIKYFRNISTYSSCCPCITRSRIPLEFWISGFCTWCWSCSFTYSIILKYTFILRWSKWSFCNSIILKLMESSCFSTASSLQLYLVLIKKPLIYPL